MKPYSRHKSEIKQSDKKIENMKINCTFSVGFLNKEHRRVWYQIVQNLVLNAMQTFLSAMNIDEINKKLSTVYFTEIYKVPIQP